MYRSRDYDYGTVYEPAVLYNQPHIFFDFYKVDEYTRGAGGAGGCRGFTPPFRNDFVPQSFANLVYSYKMR
jgi:hypothetical protein